ncbi:putative quinate [Hortaea werneckii]|uniref:Quinate transporter n=1 Tax=Hortaea werneckii TaxID=91943 RepID=A0A3M7F0K1_HORWE|nr:putative quinate [Hortaea werneckii]KAI6878546.1 putative quinate [Hortaea werneckii]KAI6986467.1 putative quinate [Hortaea werneckii]KAI7140723.1 putative quinate [Hortaea werneckii]KAI7167668.1 putative quinate [Hortaea werneckii]
MGLLSLVEDRPTPKAVYNWRVWACAAVASFASCMIGYDSAFIGTTIALDSFQDEFGFPQMSESEANLITSNIVSVYQAGAFFGALFAYVSAHWLGRKWSLIAWAVLFQIGAGIMLASNGSRGLGPIYAGRVIAGLAVGATSNITPIYISEISPPAVRGRLVGVYEVGWQVGGLVGFWINYGLVQTMAPSHEQWIIPFAVQLIPGGMLLIGAFWLRETPRWLMQKNRREEALKNLSWIRNLPQDDIYMVEEVAYIDGSLEEQAAAIGIGFWKPFKAVANNRRVQYRFILGSMLFLWQNGSGINAINYYSPTVFRSLGVDGDTTFLMTGIFGVVKTVITFFWLFFLIDNLGRRPLLMIGAAGGSVCMWIIGGYLNANPVTDGGSVNNLSGGGIAAIFFFYLWTAFYIPSWNGTPWVYNSEMFPQSVRSLGQAIAAASNWFWNFIIARFTPQMFSNMGPSGCGVYYFFASMMILSIIWVWFLMPETKGIPLESMDRLFQVRPPRKAHKQIHAEDEMREQEFRQDAEGAELSVAKDKLDHYEQRSPSE